jgi:hypothetical protein
LRGRSKGRAKEILQKHPFKDSARVLPTRTFHTSQVSEEVDLALVIGTTLFAVEIKYGHFPTEPHEIHKFIDGARAAAAQARRKAKFKQLRQARLTSRRRFDVPALLDAPYVAADRSTVRQKREPKLLGPKFHGTIASAQKLHRLRHGQESTSLEMSRAATS